MSVHDNQNFMNDSHDESSSEKTKSIELDENYFSHHSDVLSMETVKEIETAIDKCKDNILALEETSEEKRLLVQRLVKLRLKLQEVQELEIYMDPKKMKVVQNHKFITQGVLQKRLRSPQVYCETCCGVIWIPIQNCFVCSECDYVSHGQCLTRVRRVCASVKTAENPNYVLEICPEKCLESQNYRCAECKARISFDATLNQPMLCDYSGEYFCKDCHWGNVSVIPARVILNWDFNQYPVSQSAKQYLKLMVKKSVINLESINPRLYSFVEELALIKRLRGNIMIMKEYILTCKDALETRLLRLLEDRQHFVDNSENYSLQDLIDVDNKVLVEYLEPIYSQFEQHITQDCVGCRGKGHVCRLCNNHLSIVFPFQSNAALCKNCRSVYHRSCFIKKDTVCLKCSKGHNNNYH